MQKLQADAEQLSSIKQGFEAWRHGLSIVVYDSDSDPLFSCPDDWDARTINHAITVWNSAFLRGEQSGKRKVQGLMRVALGLEQA